MRMTRIMKDNQRMQLHSVQDCRLIGFLVTDLRQSWQQIFVIRCVIVHLKEMILLNGSRMKS